LKGKKREWIENILFLLLQNETKTCVKIKFAKYDYQFHELLTEMTWKEEEE
jgi:DNA-binding FadR family transcriptional regulator